MTTLSTSSAGGGPYQKMNMSPKEYQDFAKQREPSRSILTNCVKAFVIGGLICVLGEFIQQLYVHLAGMDKKAASNPTVATLIFISVVLTSLGVYDKIAQWAGAGTAVPVTGFANSMCSAALEHRTEGLVLGVGANMFKLAGSVIVYGTVAAFFVGIGHLIFGTGGNH
ncbi:stage V sporulation protein AC [Paenibacillus sp. PR3]|uniref:Stage V sporulation protein AC n=1 Tax=Paenibacillus terricola TaxID=2763503 RepID=A0ABR8MSK1_9BACL|nr:stage V sporulation protein AC [Paenibacillus terricola]MBD3917887.1 stage V sporulation protein AC [Paenibacillus terricola]